MPGRELPTHLREAGPRKLRQWRGAQPGRERPSERKLPNNHERLKGQTQRHDANTLVRFQLQVRELPARSAEIGGPLE